MALCVGERLVPLRCTAVLLLYPRCALLVLRLRAEVWRMYAHTMGSSRPVPGGLYSLVPMRPADPVRLSRACAPLVLQSLRQSLASRR